MTTTARRESKPELLAPAGDWEALKAAVANGADAVYFGLSNFNARHRATNFSLEDGPGSAAGAAGTGGSSSSPTDAAGGLRAVMDYLHAHNVRGYVAFNTLIFSEELESAEEYLRAIAAAGVDAIIVQDLGIVWLAHALAPTLAIHGSTQMTLTEARGIEFVRSLGVQRVVLARELTLAEIQRITAASNLPVEVFVHGALCIAYSGQCLTSESLGGRSANRGQCAQACRLPYQLVVDGQVRDLGDKAYLLSPQDLAAHDLIGDLAAAGVTSFKIEGRLKSAHYVAAATQTYRAAVDALEACGEKDAADAGRFHISAQQRMDLEQSFSRGFGHGFLGGLDHQALVGGRFSKARGTRIGTVVRIAPPGIVIELERSGRAVSAEQLLKPGDGVVFDEGHPEQDEQGGRVFAVRPAGSAGQPRTQREGGGAGEIVNVLMGEGDVNLSAIAVGAIVWKTDDPAVKKRLAHSFSRDTVIHRARVDAVLRARVSAPPELTLSAEGNSVTAVGSAPLAAATKFPMTREMVCEQLDRLGDTPFELGDVELISSTPGPMLPKSVLNDLRRQAVAELLVKRGRVHAIANADALANLRTRTLGTVEAARGWAFSNDGKPALSVLARTLEQLDAILADARPALVYADFEDVRRYNEAVTRCRAAGVPIALATLRVVKPTEEGFLRQVASRNPDAVLVRNLAAVSFYREHFPALAQLGDYTLNVANELTAGVFLEAGLRRLVPSYDLNMRQLSAMLRRLGPAGAGLCEIVIHQHVPMFHMEHCVFAHTLSNGKDYRDCGRPCDRHKVDLTDRVGEAHPLIPDVGCRNTLFNATPQTAADFVPELAGLGIRNFRVELLRQSGAEAVMLVQRYQRLIAGEEAPAATLRSLRVLNQLGVTRGTLDRE